MASIINKVQDLLTTIKERPVALAIFGFVCFALGAALL